MDTGTKVRILPPFNSAFPGVYAVGSIDGETAFLDGIPEGFANAFAIAFLEVVNE